MPSQFELDSIARTNGKVQAKEMEEAHIIGIDEKHNVGIIEAYISVNENTVEKKFFLFKKELGLFSTKEIINYKDDIERKEVI